MLKIMTLDVESVGLHGEGFSVGWSVRDESRQEINSGYFGCPIVTAKGEDSDRCWAGPYPLMEIATVLQMAGIDPLGKYERLPDEMPAHHPTCDARQSGRILFEAMEKIGGDRDE